MDKNFGFDDNRTRPSTKNSSGCNAFYTAFQCDKPYRLAFYVQPNIRRRRLIANRTNVNNTTSNVDTTRNINISSVSAQNTTMNKTEEIIKPATKKGNVQKRVNDKEISSVSAQNTTINKTEEIIKPATKKGNIRKRVNNKENEGKNKSKNSKKEETKAVLSETENTLTETRQSGRLRELKRYSATYAKKPSKPKEPAKPKEPSRTKQKEPARTKQKDPATKKTKTDPDFDKWVEDLNKEFNEVDNFNISVSYD